MSALEKQKGMDRDEKMSTMAKKVEVEEQHPLEAEPQGESRTGTKPRGCVSHGGLY